MFVFVWRYDWCRRLANLKIVSKVADLICIVWQVLKFCQVHCVWVCADAACLLSPVVYLVHVIRTAKIVDECSTDYIYLAALSHNIRNKKYLKNFKACPY